MTAPSVAPPQGAVEQLDPPRGVKRSNGDGRLWRSLWRHRALYLMAVPGIVYFLLFKYLPMGGLVIAFQNYMPFLGISESPWVGFDHFVRFFTEDTFFMLLRNTLVISALLLVFAFPVPILLALMLNELRGRIFKRSIQSVVYLPHFMSWVIV